MNKLTRFQLNNLISTIQDYGLDYISRNVFLFGEISQESCAAFIKNFVLLEQSEEEINVYINSEGGDCYEGFAIYDCIKNSHCHVNITVYGQCCSMASIILQAGDARILAPCSILMVHEGSVYIEDNLVSAQKYMRDVQRAHTLTLDIYVEACKSSNRYEGWTDKRLRGYLDKKIKGEWYMTAESAISYGFADEVLGK